MMRATSDLVDTLHGAVASILVDALRQAKENHEVPSPQLLAQAIKFLKDNGVDAPARAGGPIDNLLSELQDLDLEVEARTARPN